MAGFVVKLQELKENIVHEFDAFKDFNNYGDVDHLNHKGLDSLLFKIKYHVDQLKNVILSEKGEEDIMRTRIGELEKAEALIKLQTLSSLITYHVINLDRKLNTKSKC